MCSELDRARVARDDTMHFDDKTTDWLGNHQNFLGTAAVEFFFESWHTSASQPTNFKDASCY